MFEKAGIEFIIQIRKFKELEAIMETYTCKIETPSCIFWINNSKVHI